MKKEVSSIQIVFIKKSDSAILPKRMTINSSCLDLYCDVETLIPSGMVVKVSTNISFIIPSDYEIQIRPRSGLSLKGIITIFGTVDADFKLPICAIVYNSTKEDYIVKKGDRIAQIKIVKNCSVKFVDSLGNELIHSSDDRKGGFGSTN